MDVNFIDTVSGMYPIHTPKNKLLVSWLNNFYMKPNILIAIMQGDEEKDKGITPVDMMDRDRADQLPESQVQQLQTNL